MLLPRNIPSDRVYPLPSRLPTVGQYHNSVIQVRGGPVAVHLIESYEVQAGC